MAKTQSRRERKRSAPPAPVRLCQECGAEYLGHVTACSDCHVPLFQPVADDRTDTLGDHAWEVFQTMNPREALFLTAALKSADVPYEVHESTLISDRLSSVLVADDRALEALRIVKVMEEQVAERSPEEVAAIAKTLPLPSPEDEGFVDETFEGMDGERDDTEHTEDPPLAPAESARALLFHIGAGALWFGSLLSFEASQTRHALWWIAAVACAGAALALHARGRALTRQWRAQNRVEL